MLLILTYFMDASGPPIEFQYFRKSMKALPPPKTAVYVGHGIDYSAILDQVQSLIPGIEKFRRADEFLLKDPTKERLLKDYEMAASRLMMLTSEGAAKTSEEDKKKKSLTLNRVFWRLKGAEYVIFTPYGVIVSYYGKSEAIKKMLEELDGTNVGVKIGFNMDPGDDSIESLIRPL